MNLFELKGSIVILKANELHSTFELVSYHGNFSLKFMFFYDVIVTLAPPSN